MRRSVQDASIVDKNACQGKRGKGRMQIKESTQDCARVFFALWPGSVTQKALHAVATKFQKYSLGRVMRTETLHLTLLFLGEVEHSRLPRLVEVAEEVKVPCFQLNLDHFAIWRHNKIGYVAPQVTAPELEALVQKLWKAVSTAGFQFDRRTFKPHLTLLRNIEHAIEAQAFTPIEWHVESFALVESVANGRGVDYRLLQTWPLI